MLCLTNITPEAVFEQLSAAWDEAARA